MDLKQLEEVFSDFFSKKDISVEEWKKMLAWYSGDDFKKYIHFSDESYARNYVVNTELFDILILCWWPGQKTGIHGHPKDGCFVKILQGSIHETIYDSNKKQLRENLHSAGDIMYNHDSIGYHVLQNPNNTGTISLHIYSPGNYKPTLI